MSVEKKEKLVVTKEMRDQFSDVIYSVSHSDKYETILKEVIETGKEADLELVLNEYVDKRELEIQTICNDQFQKFISCTEQLGSVKEKMIKTQQRLQKTSSRVKGSSDNLFSKIKLLSNNRVSTINIMKTLSWIEKLKTILETVKKIEDDIAKGHISRAFMVYDRLRKLPLFEENEYKIIQLINLRLDTVKANLKAKAEKLFKRWCDVVTSDMEKIGNSIMDHDKQMKKTQSLVDEDFGAFEKSEINFVWLYEAYFIHTSFQTTKEFVDSYLQFQKKRYEDIKNIQKPTLNAVLAKMLGFFVIEHHVQQTTEHIISSEKLQDMWTDASQYMKMFKTSDETPTEETISAQNEFVEELQTVKNFYF
ncbi:hypothetical protein EIN_095940 [Entamoeba invadens IP1]|uniref:Exocyst complex component EXOC6/Sec15 N-terminal domain-containing protein n=1 Tax=Entamoeba invadens IP1 TaxID=370355 RepID=A0A0A1U0D0_ENTIV|nr:hypothetical protein EIN_095940 [Entamoeba invadens IP1]ELP87337.1 hypothetical protein EIN_095940 [Entamoeba invadens IP1]|eukprot:XP_004254108.1 hypothetical protein EIN_095940 [Entamoeba invadens IP1]